LIGGSFEKNDFSDIHAVRAVLPSTGFADPYTIFNIKGNITGSW